MHVSIDHVLANAADKRQHVRIGLPQDDWARVFAFEK